ncbi:unnamed protein product [Ranitomeya imitator]|uniref:Rhodanese domain-containing protein n=1 Tax=Ranitomeya imitator TaxID=111125 RepID=A0ABN9M9H8_9NEOB|nr:unnamed protein product [Ranitomeya imitator]
MRAGPVMTSQSHDRDVMAGPSPIPSLPPEPATEDGGRRERLRRENVSHCVLGRFYTSVAPVLTDLEDALKMDPETFKQKYHVEKPQLNDHNLILHCQLGRRGQRATEVAQSLGYK